MLALHFVRPIASGGRWKQAPGPRYPTAGQLINAELCWRRPSPSITCAPSHKAETWASRLEKLCFNAEEVSTRSGQF